MRTVLGRRFFDRRATAVAPELLGKFLVRRAGRREDAYMIVETEAYEGKRDLACHASRGRTKRTEVMFGEPGHWYVYIIYGLHHMLNIVTGPGKTPSAVLIRGVASFQRPGVLTREMHINRSFNGKKAFRESGLWIEDRGVHIPRAAIKQKPRIGVEYAKEWARKPWRYILEKSAK